MKSFRLLTLLLFCFSFVLLPIRAEAAESGVASDSNSNVATPSNPVRVISVNHPEYDLYDMPALEYIQTDTDYNNYILVDVMSFIQQIGKVEATVLLQDGTEETTSISVSINRQSLAALLTLDPRIVSSAYVLADIKYTSIRAEYGTYELDDGLLQQITVPIKIVIPDEPILLTHLDSEYANYYDKFQKVIAILPTDDLNLVLEPDSDVLIFCSTDSKARYSGRIIWDGSSVDMTKPGIYHVPVSYQLPLHCELAPNAVLPDVQYWVIVQEPEKPQLYEYSQITNSFPWKISTEHVKDIKVLISKDEGPWEELRNDGKITWNQNGLFFIAQLYFTPNSSYRLQVDYRDGKTNIVSFTYDDVVVVIDSYQGDRDGGDTNGNPPLIGGGKPSDENIGDSIIGGNNSDNNDFDSEDTSTNSPESTPEESIEPLPNDDTTTETTAPSETITPSETTTAETEAVQLTVKSEPVLNETAESIPKEAISNEMVPAETTTQIQTTEPSTIDPAPETSSLESSAFSDEISSSEASSSETAIGESEITQTLPIVTAVAAIIAIASLLFLNFTKRRNDHDMESS